MEALVMIGVQMLIGAALWGLGMLLSKPIHREGPKADKDVQISTYGAPIPLLYGQCKNAMQLIWATKLKEHRHEESVGKGGGGTVVTYTYSCSWSGLFGVAPDPAVFGERQLLKLWIDSKLAFNAMADADKVTQAKAMKKFKFYTGSMTQLPDTTMQAVLGATNVPAYRGYCYGTFKDLNVTPYGNRVPTIRAITGPGTASTPGIYPVTGTVRDAGDDWFSVAMGLNYDAATVLSQDEQWVVLGLGWWDAVANAYFTWFLVSTATRQVVATRTYSEPGFGTSYCDDTDYVPYYYWQGIDLDEQGYIYAAACEGYGKIHRLDMQTFTVQAVGPEVNPYSGQLERLLVSKNPLYPYLWGWATFGSGYDYMWLMHRDTLASPFNAADYGHEFVSPETGNYPTRYSAIISAAINQQGSCWVLWDVYTQTSPAVRTYYIARYECNGIAQTWDITSSMTGYTPLLNLMAYDPGNDQLLVGVRDGSNYEHIRFLDATLPTTVNGTTGNDEGPSHQYAVAEFQRGVSGNHFYCTRIDGHILKIDVTTYSAVDDTDISSQIGASYLLNGLYVGYKSSMFALLLLNDIHMQEISLGRLTTGTALLSNIVSDLCKRTGLEAADINVAQLTDEVKGYSVDEDVSTRQAIEPLMEVFIFDSAEMDGVLEFIKRGGASVATIPEADLGACQFGADRTVLAEITDQNELNLPRRVQVLYPDINRKHEQGVQYYDRQLTDSKRIKDINSKVLMNADDAKQLAHVSFKFDWSAMPVEFSVGPKYAKLRATDVVTLSKTEGTYRVLLLEGRSEGLRTTWKGVVESSSYASDITGEQLPVPDEDVFFPGPSIYQLMDLPPLLDAHNNAGVYLASGAYFSDWTGCSVYVSKDSGDSWILLTDISERSVTGVSLEALPDFTYNKLDDTNSLTVRWDYSGDALASKTTAEFWNGQAHYLLVGEEIVCAKDVVTNADGTQTFGPPLIRGARGTEYAKADHAAGDPVIVLSMTATFFGSLDTSYLNQSYLYAGISHGADWEEASKRIFTTELRTLKPWAGVQAEGARDGDNNLLITWRRRDRFGHLNPLRAGVEVPMSETTESYEVDILLSSVVVRTISSLPNESAWYTAAQQTTDGYTPGDPVDCEIYQISATTGRGWELAATV